MEAAACRRLFRRRLFRRSLGFSHLGALVETDSLWILQGKETTDDRFEERLHNTPYFHSFYPWICLVAFLDL